MLFSLLLLACSPVEAEELPTVESLLQGVDTNMTFETRMIRAEMTVVKPKRTKVYEFLSYGRGVDEAATEFLAPSRDAGTKMLKKGDELWIYLPSVEKVQKMSGHMLRQGMMGSDVSYEDMMESSSWLDAYTAEVTGADMAEGRDCWLLEMKAKTDEVSYPTRKVWVDKEHLIPVKQELYAVSGVLLKTWLMTEPMEYEGRQYPTRMIIDDSLQEGSRTEMHFKEMDFSVDVEDEIFSMRWLER